MAVLARKYLAVQATSAPSERIFSRAQRIISDLRTKLDPDIAGRTLYVLLLAENLYWYEKQMGTSLND